MNLAYFDTALGFAAVMLLLSMLVTILVQMATTFLNLRGNNLLWGLSRLILQVAPGAKAANEAAEVAEKSAKKAREDAKNAKDAVNAAEAVRLAEEKANKARAEAMSVNQLAEKILSHDTLSHSLGRYATAIRYDELKLVVDEYAESSPPADDPLGAALKDTAKKVKEAMSDAKKGVDAWFNAIMDRTTERFKGRTTVVTGIFAFVLAFALHIDTLHIMEQLSSKPEVRAAVIASALKDAAPLFDEVRKAKALPVATLEALAVTYPAELKAADKYQKLSTRADGRRWIEANVTNAGVRPKLIKDYEEKFDAIGRDRMTDLNKSYTDVRGWLESSQLKLGPEKARYCTANDFSPSLAWVRSVDCDFANMSWGHALGMLVTALFLSLGAPFWFNALRNMSNLRPILAGKVEPGTK